MSNYHPVVCQACHNVVLVDGMDPWAYRTLIDTGWTHDGKDYMCCGKEKAQAVRKHVQAFVKYERNAKFNFKVGAQAALQGFDCLSKDEDYIKGHALGMSIRATAANLGFKESVK